MKNLILLFCFFLVGACSNHPCREVSTDGVPEAILKKTQAPNVLVYKYDGSKQCNKGQEVSLDAMSRELQDIKIYSMSKKNDGRIRIQVCGATTGFANVYEISEKDLKKAEGYGFKLWTIR